MFLIHSINQTVMKSKLLTLLSITLLFIFSGCEKDNYKAPDATITGRVVYQNLPLGVRSDGVQLELYQPGYAFSTVEVWR